MFNKWVIIINHYNNLYLKILNYNIFKQVLKYNYNNKASKIYL